MKRVLAAVVALMMVLGLVPGVAEAQPWRQAYADVLRENEMGIRAYWQGGWEWVDGIVVLPAQEPRDIAFVDITSDGVPEMIFVSAPDRQAATLYIYTWDGAGAQLCVEHPFWDVVLDSFNAFCLYTAPG